MVSIKDLIEVMDRWSDWKKVKQLAESVPALEQRIAELEKRLERCPGEACPFCGYLEFRAERSHVPRDGTLEEQGAREYEMKCGHCGKTDTQIRFPKRK